MVRKCRKNREEWKIYGNVFDEFTNRNIENLANKGFFKEILRSHQLGKEANIFSAITEDNDKVIIKIYRVENCNFNKMYDYIKEDPRYFNLKKQKRQIIFAWVQREFRNLMKARLYCKVPKPIGFKDNIIILEYIGDKESDITAPQLKDIKFEDREHAINFFIKIIKELQNLFKAGLVHGDISAFNILYEKDRPVLIDFSQTVPIKSQNSRIYMERDLKNLMSYFKRYKIYVDIEEIINIIIGKKKIDNIKIFDKNINDIYY